MSTTTTIKHLMHRTLFRNTSRFVVVAVICLALTLSFTTTTEALTCNSGCRTTLLQPSPSSLRLLHLSHTAFRSIRLHHYRSTTATTTARSRRSLLQQTNDDHNNETNVAVIVIDDDTTIMNSNNYNYSGDMASTTRTTSFQELEVVATNDRNHGVQRQEKSIKTTSSTNVSSLSSKRAMLSFAIPALGIYLCNPLLSNIDNAFVGRTMGTIGLAALSPATICIDQMLYLFNFLGRATTGIVTRAYYSTTATTTTTTTTTTTPSAISNPDDANGGNTLAARDAASAPLVVSLFCGIAISLFYAIWTPQLLRLLRVEPMLQSSASSYIYWRGAIAWAALAQSVCLSTLMATRDAMTPLRIIALAAVVNIFGDAAFCVWPFRWGCAGAAAATSIATLISCGFMIQALAKKEILPNIRRMPSRKDLFALFEFTGPLLAITMTRLCSYIAMQRYAMKLGVQALAGYQLCINIFLFFGLFGEPFSQLSQTQLPSLLDRNDGPSVRATFKSILTLGTITSFVIGAATYALTFFGPGLISSDIAVQQVARVAAPALALNVACGIIANSVDGAFLASKDFTFLTGIGASSFLLQLTLLPFCTSIGGIFGTFTIRLALYTVIALGRIALGHGGMGRVFWSGYEGKRLKAVQSINR